MEWALCEPLSSHRALQCLQTYPVQLYLHSAKAFMLLSTFAPCKFLAHSLPTPPSPLFPLLSPVFIALHNISSMLEESVCGCIQKPSLRHLTKAGSILWLPNLLGKSFTMSQVMVSALISPREPFLSDFCRGHLQKASK